MRNQAVRIRNNQTFGTWQKFYSLAQPEFLSLLCQVSPRLETSALHLTFVLEHIREFKESVRTDRVRQNAARFFFLRHELRRNV
jgi:hypothetical protein